MPCSAFPTAPVPTSLLPCWVHTPPERVNTHAAPTLPLSPSPPTRAVLPSPDTDTEMPCLMPCLGFPTAPVPTSLLPCWVHTPPERVKTHVAPVPPLSESPPTRAVLPSADTDSAPPCSAFPIAPVPTSFPPCWTNCALAAPTST